MCIFTDVARVRDTKIYASLHGDEQGQAPQAKLAVKRVGVFEATFVPRLEVVADRRALPSGLRHRGGCSFAVFQLRAGAHRIHPMAQADRKHDVASILGMAALLR